MRRESLKSRDIAETELSYKDVIPAFKCLNNERKCKKLKSCYQCSLETIKLTAPIAAKLSGYSISVMRLKHAHKQASQLYQSIHAALTLLCCRSL